MNYTWSRVVLSIAVPPSNGFVERFNCTADEEFLAWRKKLCTSLDELQADLDK